MGRIEPSVSVVIPTFKRPHLVVRAVRSALVQTLSEIEVIVVLDGPDEAASEVLRQIDDPRLRVQTLPRHLGAGDALNAGVALAESRWVAFLDDDDEWFPGKLEIQLRTAEQSHYLCPIISCRLIARNEEGDFIWPRRFPKPGEPINEYMFCRKSPFWGEGLVQNSTIFTTKELLQKVPFKSNLPRHQDFDWLLRASAREGVGVEFAPESEPLSVWNRKENNGRKSSRADLSYSLSWIQENRHLVTPRAYASFIMTMMSEKGVREGKWKAFFPLLWKAYRYGKSTIFDTMLYLGIWLVPQRARHLLAAGFTGGAP